MKNMVKQFFFKCDEIGEYYSFLVDKTKNLEYVGITNEWVIDNYYILVEHKNNILKDKKFITKRMKKCSHLFSVIEKIVVKNQYSISFNNFVKELQQYQKDNNIYFMYEEIEMIPQILLFIYINKLDLICKSEYRKLRDKDKVAKIIEENEFDTITIDDFFDDEVNISKDSNYIFEINYQLKELGSKGNRVFKELNKVLRENNLSIKQILNDCFQERLENDLLISNIFNNLKDFFEYSREDFYENISKCEEYLMEDPIYNKMTEETKILYRKQILKLSKRKRINEIDFIKELLDKADKDDYHVGFMLFKNKSNKEKVVFYILTIVLFSVLFSYLLSNYFIKNRILGFVILLIPVSQLFIKVFHEILMRFVKSKPIFKMDYTKGIPKKCATMVVIPTIVSTPEKVYKTFDMLETYYLVNKTSNLYFSLLADVKGCQSSDYEYDEDIARAGIDACEKLNKKYKKDIFHFVYRKRLYNEHEGEYLGYERKRGALLQFNRLLLKTFPKDLEEKYFRVNTLKNLDEEIKYVITLDSDTKLVLNTALNLVGAMDHPLNKPKLNKSENKVISGHALMQPRVSTDIEATNKSLYSQIFAGIGGFDTYSALVPDVYQDLFDEGSFCGKGIYDLEVFDKVLYDKFPDNLILSHDLLEGNYLRSAYISDIELIDDFPSKFLIDITRIHRWARGDVQISGWLFPYIKNKEGQKVKNEINLLGRLKILDNIIRMFLYPMLLLILILSFISPNTYFWQFFVGLEIAIPIIFFLRSKLYRKGEKLHTVYYKNLLFGGKSLFLRSYIVFATIPYYTKVYMDAFFRTIYRMFISHKNLLNWITAEDAEKNSKSDLKSYLKTLWINLVIAFIFIVLGILNNNVVMIILALVFVSSPFILYFISRDIEHNKIELNEKEIDEVADIAYRTWLYFKENLTEENNYLIPDNYQENREVKFDYRTSSTDIAFSLTSIVSAYSLEFITIEEAVSLIRNILTTVKKLEKWNGHLYNWYDIKTMKAMYPRFVSTIDSGNFIAALMVVKEFLEENNEEELVLICEKMIKSANFKKLYTKKDVFSIGYEEGEGKLSIYNYNKFASESRLTSFIAICKGDVSSKHWFCLDKSLTSHNYHKGLISWSGTSFEYYMPLLFMKNYPNTLLDESYHFARYCQKDYMEGVDRHLPWGMSESAYYELDNSQNYKYYAFSTPYLKAKEDKDNRIVISPYSSIMAMELFPDDVYHNILKFKKLDMLDKYGLYESYDHDNKAIVPSYFAHHQGMSLIGFVNYLKNGVIKNYFHSNVSVKTFDILLKEKVQIKTNIDIKMAKYKKYNYKREQIENDIRVFNYISDMPEMSVLSNKKYCLVMNDRGNSFSRYRTLQLNRYRKITEQDYGIFLYIKDKKTGKIWSNTYAPVNEKPEKYEVIFAADKIKYLRKDGDVTTKTEIVVTKNHHAEIRKITFKNESDTPKVLELTTYTEPILSEKEADVSHKVFNNMFLSSEYDSDTNSLIMLRKSRNDTHVNSYMIERLIIDEPLEDYSYETDRFEFIGRNHSAKDPVALNKRLTNSCGTSLEPVMSIRNSIEVDANSSKSVYLINGFGRSKAQLFDIINSYKDKRSINKAFEVSTLMNVMNTKILNIKGTDMRLYNIMLNYLYQTTKIAVSRERVEHLKSNSLNQTGLWKFGVSGDRPIILVNIYDITDLSFVFEILKAFEYYKNISIFVDLIIVNSENDQYAKIIKKEIDDEIYRMYTLNSFYHTPGSITVIDQNDITNAELALLQVVARLSFDTSDHKSLTEKIEQLQNKNKASRYPSLEVEENIKIPATENLDFLNTYGGFRNNYTEYVIDNKNTPTPWSNIISNKNFGTIVTNNGCGFTYAYSSGEYKITSWSNEMIVNDKSEGIKINGKIFDPDKCIHGFGYTTLYSEDKHLKKEVCEFVAKDDNVKIYLVKLTNKLKRKQKLEVSYWLNPTLGNFEEKTSRHILTEYIDNENYLKLRNVYSIDYSDVVVFLSSSLPLKSAVDNKVLVKEINTEVVLEKEEEKYFVFTLGCTRSDIELFEYLKKYNNVDNALKELKLVKENWKKTLNTFSVKTPDKSFNAVMNGWYLYQTISSRIYARSGFYQVSGAFGYRDQLQDSMNISMIKPDIARAQILKNASHQFIEGDVLHWWHDKSRFGLRTRYKDDYLWLVYATCIYLRITKDYSILEEKVPFVEGANLTEHEHEKGMVFNFSKEEKTLLEHCILSLKLSMNSLGKHKLPLMGGGDWNDGMNKVGIKGKGESVWLGFFLYGIINDFISMMSEYDKDFSVEEYEKFNEKLKKALNKHAWDKEYYLRAYFDNGDKLGSHENSECKIDLISQSFAILSGAAPKERCDSALKSVEELLVDRNSRILKLLTPAFEKSLNNPGYIMNYPKGIRENGGQYTHGASWYIMALLKHGNFDLAYEYYQMINPINRTLDKDGVEKYKTEPYVIAADIYSNELHPGRGGWTWYTGSAGWFYRIGLEEILGIKKFGEELEIIPQIPNDWNGYKVNYNYQDTLYKIEVIRNNKNEIILDNKKIKNKIPLKNDKKTHEVKVYIK